MLECCGLSGLAASCLAWQLPAIELRGEPFLQASIVKALLVASMIEGRHLTNTPWSFALLAFGVEPFLQAISSAAIPRISAFEDAQHLANTSWSFAVRVYSFGPLRDALSAASRAMINQFAPPHLASTAWALAR
eukprot:gnl/MRDRNA2_/MRDRNA2_86648_c0_seq11.p1 gnl/MRDRNA2_/MRDRNA2_86648_c0~~gnl/MRDRNA2_/MRDRNA2_86648_c0_seq11.p1  ORF type:complete len:134 (+),score=14.08 gnl/MRDRNA2_/MRDRNA2_86648_c0_seq11:81-482(+)